MCTPAVQSPQAVKPDGICWALLAPEADILRTWHPAVAQRGLEPAPGRQVALPRWPAPSCSWSRSPAHSREDAVGPVRWWPCIGESLRLRLL